MSDMGRARESHDYAERAVGLLRDLGGTGLANALNELGHSSADLGDLAGARALCLEALEATGDEAMPERTRAAVLDTLGTVERLDKSFAEAAGYYAESIALRREIGELYPQATSLLKLGQVAEESGDLAAAATARAEALAILESLDHPEASTVRTLLAGH